MSPSMLSDLIDYPCGVGSNGISVVDVCVSSSVFSLWLTVHQKAQGRTSFGTPTTSEPQIDGQLHHHPVTLLLFWDKQNRFQPVLAPILYLVSPDNQAMVCFIEFPEMFVYRSQWVKPRTFLHMGGPSKGSSSIQKPLRVQPARGKVLGFVLTPCLYGSPAGRHPSCSSASGIPFQVPSR
jgi:hypothetical protein